jgi:hypothetical protein
MSVPHEQAKEKNNGYKLTASLNSFESSHQLCQLCRICT